MKTIVLITILICVLFLIGGCSKAAGADLPPIQETPAMAEETATVVTFSQLKDCESFIDKKVILTGRIIIQGKTLGIESNEAKDAGDFECPRVVCLLEGDGSEFKKGMVVEVIGQLTNRSPAGLSSTAYSINKPNIPMIAEKVTIIGN